MKASTLLLALSLTACASASGYDPKKYASNNPAPTQTSTATDAIDPDTQPLADEPKGKILDPKNPMPPPPPPPPSAAPPSSAASSASATGSAPTNKPKPPTPPATTGTAKTPAVDADCGTRDNPCAMQKLMRGQMTAASSPAQLEAAFQRVAGLSPNPGWSWAAISKKGAELAKAGDIPGSKAQCKACHDQYKEAYKQQFRGRRF